MRYRLLPIICMLMGALLWSACSDDEVANHGIPVDNTPLKLTAVSPSEGTTLDPGTVLATFDFEQEVWLLDKSKITLNGEATNKVAAVGKQVRVSVDATAGRNYEVRLAVGAIRSLGGYVSTQDYVANFSCKEAVQGERSPEAVNLLNYLKEQNGNHVLAGTMANVSWNDNEAYWVYTKTGKYPALNCVDYIHLYASPAEWIDYSKTDFLEEWWKNNGIVAAMWHWNMIANNGTDYSFTPGTEPEQTSFDVTKINDTSSKEYAQMMSDIDKVADYLLLLQKKNIPVIWRPLHEAGGQWFWWGKDKEAFKTLWRTMYNRFREKGLNNLIWVWTIAVKYDQAFAEGADWYPGDDCVDIVAYDMYEVADPAKCYTYYQFMQQQWPDKLITLGECGTVATIPQQWDAGAHWSWFMPWYDAARTADRNAAAFTEDSHTHADAGWWKAALDDERVITRDEVPSLK